MVWTLLSLLLLIHSTAGVSSDHNDDDYCAAVIHSPPPAPDTLYVSPALAPADLDYNEVESDETCITHSAVGEAFEEALTRIGIPQQYQSSNVSSEEDYISAMGTLMQETTRSLARTYGLSKREVNEILPTIDTSRISQIARFCPPFLLPSYPEGGGGGLRGCRIERYRSLGGRCNNLENPTWGSARLAHHRFLPPDYADHISAPRVSRKGNPLPSARMVSTFVHHDNGVHDLAMTVILVAWGQFMDHDVTLTSETKDRGTGKTPKCCEGPVHPNCFPIEVPINDPFYTQHKQRCINLARSPPGLRRDCRLGPRAASNMVSSFLDAGTVYGDDVESQRSLRTFEKGLLKTLHLFKGSSKKPILPLRLESPNEGCLRPSEDVYCFLAGDARVNEQTALATVHTLMVREHNRIATEIGRINPHWNDETVFQETRHIVAAIVQHITYNEWLPMVLGKKVMQQYDLLPRKDGYFEGYDPTVNPSTANEFATAAFRLGHTLLPDKIERWSNTHQYVGSQKLSELLMQPYDLFKEGWMDSYLMGLTNQVVQAYDADITEEVTNHLFQEPGKKFGLDLISLNIQRGREHGLPSYNRWREFCGLRPVKHWDDLVGIMRNHSRIAYSKIYDSPEDIDLWSAGVSEIPTYGGLIGPTFSCIFGHQFRNYRYGDRFWYENGGGWPSSFTLEQLEEVRKVKLSRLICDNSDDVATVQVYAMVLPDHDINPRVACRTGVLPRLDLTKWRDELLLRRRSST